MSVKSTSKTLTNAAGVSVQKVSSLAIESLSTEEFEIHCVWSFAAFLITDWQEILCLTVRPLTLCLNRKLCCQLNVQSQTTAPNVFPNSVRVERGRRMDLCLNALPRRLK